MARNLLIGLVAFGVLLAAVACGGASTAPSSQPAAATQAPAATAALPTNAPIPTAVPPTSAPQPTAVPPTEAPAAAATSPSSADSSISTTFADALKNARAAQVYRVEMELKASGQLANPGGTGTISDQEATILSMSGAVKNKDSDLKLNGVLIGLIAGFLGLDPTGGVEFMTVGGKNFVYGKVNGSSQAQWYTMDSQSSTTQTPIDPSTLLDAFEKANMKPDQFKKVSTESLDNIQCDVYAGDKDAVVKAFTSVSGSGQALDPSTVDDANMKFYICQDKYLHSMQMNLAAHDKNKPDQKGTFALNMHIYDIDADIKIEPPAGAQPLKVPGMDLGATPTPGQ